MKKLIVIMVCLLTTMAMAQTDDLPDRFRSRLEELYAESGVPGIQAAYIVGEDTRFATAIGLADSASNRPMTVETCLPAGSVGKSFLAEVVLPPLEKESGN